MQVACNKSQSCSFILKAAAGCCSQAGVYKSQLISSKEKSSFPEGVDDLAARLGRNQGGDLGTLRLSRASYIHASIFTVQLLAWNLDRDVPLDRWETQKHCKQHEAPYIYIYVYVYLYCLSLGVFGLGVLRMEVCLWVGTRDNGFILMDDLYLLCHSTSYLQGTLFQLSVRQNIDCVIIQE